MASSDGMDQAMRNRLQVIPFDSKWLAEKPKECRHIWDLSEAATTVASFKWKHGTRGSPTHYPAKYRCRHCGSTITPKDELPCAHSWQTVEHEYGPNYLKTQCTFCSQIKIELVNQQ